MAFLYHKHFNAAKFQETSIMLRKQRFFAFFMSGLFIAIPGFSIIEAAWQKGASVYMDKGKIPNSRGVNRVPSCAKHEKNGKLALTP